MKLYISDLAVWILLLFYLPLVVVVLWRIIYRLEVPWLKKSMMLTAVIVIACVIPLADVFLNSLAMHKVCSKAGLHIFKEIRVDGYLDSSGGADTLKSHPYRFTEVPDYNGKITHYERQPNGEIVSTILDQPTAEYEVVYDDIAPVPDLGVRVMHRWWVRNRLTGEAVGEKLSFAPMHGWVDRLTLNRWFGVGLPGCGGASNSTSDWRRKLLPPNTPQ